MSIMLGNYIDTNHLKPVVPSWFRMERYAYCEPISKNAASSKRIRSASLSDKKQIRK